LPHELQEEYLAHVEQRKEIVGVHIRRIRLKELAAILPIAIDKYHPHRTTVPTEAAPYTIIRVIARPLHKHPPTVRRRIASGDHILPPVWALKAPVSCYTRKTPPRTLQHVPLSPHNQLIQIHAITFVFETPVANRVVATCTLCCYNFAGRLALFVTQRQSSGGMGRGCHISSSGGGGSGDSGSGSGSGSGGGSGKGDGSDTTPVVVLSAGVAATGFSPGAAPFVTNVERRKAIHVFPRLPGSV